MAMSLSLAVSAGAAFTDQDDISEAYAEAVEVLAGTGVFEGYKDGSFGPNGSITRAEVAAIVYRVATGDVDDKQVDIFADYNVFSDVKSTDWFAGYVNFCANAEFILGYGDGTFGPQDKVTGYQALAMILRVVGYDQENEFAGPNWLVNTASVAQELDLLDNVKSGDSLGVAADRELVAELLFQAIQVPTVTHTPALGYRDWSGVTSNKNDSLGEKAFNLASKATTDDWGRPSTEWFDSKTKDEYATVSESPVVSYNVAVDECDIAKDLKLDKDAAIAEAYLNGDANALGANNKINKTDTKTEIGEQGRLTEVYETANDNEYIVVMVDQFLAKVTDVSEIEYDKNDHVKKDAALKLDVYDAFNGGTESVTLYDDEVNFEYAEDDMVLVYFDDDATSDTVEVIGLADSIEGTQTKITTKASHIVDGKEYMDAVQLNLDEAGNETTKHTWFFDTYGNIIGIADIDTIYTYGTISSIYWVDVDGYAQATITYMDGTTEEAVINSINIAGDQKDAIVLDGVDYAGQSVSYANGKLSSTKSHNEAAFTNVALYEIEENEDGELDLVEMTKLTDPTITSGVTKIDTNTYADKNTKFLVWDADGGEDEEGAYETYTGIRNVPSYVNDSFTAWVAETDEDTGVEYVFVIDPTAEADKTTVLYFNEDVTDSDYTVKDSKADVYTVYGGYVDGKESEGIKVKAAVWTESVEKALKDNAGQLCVLTLSDGYVTGVAVVDDSEDALADANDDLFAIYEGKLAAADVNKAEALLTIGGASYDIETAKLIGEDVSDWDDAVGKYIWVVYDKDVSYKTAVTVYASDVALNADEDAALAAALAAAKADAVKALNDYAAEVVANGGWTQAEDVTAADLAAVVTAETANINAATTTAAVNTALNAAKDAVWAEALADQATYNKAADKAAFDADVAAVKAWIAKAHVSNPTADNVATAVENIIDSSAFKTQICDLTVYTVTVETVAPYTAPTAVGNSVIANMQITMTLGANTATFVIPVTVTAI